jgi:hypothetical protein
VARTKAAPAGFLTAADIVDELEKMVRQALQGLIPAIS